MVLRSTVQHHSSGLYEKLLYTGSEPGCFVNAAFGFAEMERSAQSQRNFPKGDLSPSCTGLWCG